MYQFAHICDYFEDCWILSIDNDVDTGKNNKFRYLQKKIKMLGLVSFFEIIIFYPIQVLLYKIDQKKTESLINKLKRPTIHIDYNKVISIKGPVNGSNTVSAINKINPDIIIQNGAGILKKNVFSLAKIFTINLHHGIAPLIRGMFSIYWALWERKKTWVGSTVHVIDKGIDTGKVLAYSNIKCDIGKDQYPDLFKKITKSGTTDMLTILKKIENNESVGIAPIEGERNYRSTFSGLKLLILKLSYYLNK